MQTVIARRSNIAAEALLTLVAEHPAAWLRPAAMKVRCLGAADARIAKESTSGLDRS
jgi:hypothetical protein